MTVRFYKNFSKRKNSTKRPANTDAYDEKDCRLKDDTSIINPSLVISNTMASASGNPVTVNTLGGEMITPVVSFSPSQASGTPTPASPIPINGFSNIDITVNSVVTTINLGGVKYGGTLNVNTGVLTLNYAVITRTLSQRIGSAVAIGTTITRYQFMSEDLDVDVANRANSYSNKFLYSNDYNGEFIHFMFNVAATRFYVYVLNGTAMSTEFDVCYPIATPITVQLTPAQIALVTGNNTISVNGNSTIAFNYFREKIDLDYSYVYIPDFNRYYFVSNVVVLSNNRVQYILEADVLASFKTNIGSTVARIAFAATGYDADIIDSRAAVSTKKLKYERNVSTELSQNGCYILTVFNDQNINSNGLGCSYVLEQSEIGKIKNWMSQTSVISAIRNFFGGNPIDSIFSCIWVPFPYASAPNVGGFTSVEIGDQSSVNQGVTITNKVLADTGIYKATRLSLLIPYRYNDYRDAEPYTSIQIYLPGVGYVPLNISDWLDTASIKIDYSMEYSTGDLTYYLRDFNDYLIQTVSCNVASQCPLGQMLTSGGGIVSSVGGMVGGAAAVAVGAATGNALMATGGAGAILAGAANTALNANKRAASIKGNQGGRTSTEIRDIILTGFYMDTEDVTNSSYIATKGRPVAVSHAISNHSGYVECDEASVAIAGSTLERQRVNDYLNTGFFYE